MRYENNPANGFRDITQKRNADARTTAAQLHARHGDDNITRPYFVGGE